MTQDPRQIERYRGIVKFLDNTVRNIALYPPEHPSVAAPTRRMFEFLGETFDGTDRVLLGVINGVLYVNDYLFYDATPYSSNVLKILTAFDVDDLMFLKGVTTEEILGLASILKMRDKGRDEFLEQLEKAGIRHIVLKSFQEGAGDEGDLPSKGLEAYRDAIGTMRGIFGEVTSGYLPPLREAENLAEGFMDQMTSNRTLLMLLTSLKSYDAYTYQHCINVGILALLLAEREGLDERNVKWSALAGMLHDVGKARIPSQIINKAGGLTMREWEAIKSHPVHSAEVVRGMGGAEDLAQAVEGHHVHFDGGGYPVRSDKSDQAGLAGLVAVVDAYDAITTVRSYKKPMNPVEAAIYLKNGRGSRFDPHHVDAFLSMIGAYPPGAMVRLTSNEIAVVSRTGKEPGKPTVKMILDSLGRPYREEAEVDLAGADSGGRIIAAVADPAVYGLDPMPSFSS